MIVRIVRMHFMPEAVDDFLDIYGRTEAAIRNMAGCTYLELMRDAENPNVLITVSHWESVTALNNYRKSELFKSVWRRVKTLFAQPAEAFSMERHPGVTMVAEAV
ncbi:MAG: antibiotic biosynthesis monooxygenase [Bacteroidota bacterium]|jgi:quinol monooxygenase YgiN|nr:MAG: antibiotic biosynthesis monooxygenase [Bacteroidota bacterium]